MAKDHRLVDTKVLHALKRHGAVSQNKLQSLARATGLSEQEALNALMRLHHASKVYRGFLCRTPRRGKTNKVRSAP